jgi:hypothetical protein
MPIILLIVAAWLVVLSIINYFQGYGEVAAVWFVGAWLLVGVSGILSRLDALCSHFGADTRSLNVRKRKPPQEAAGEQAPSDQPPREPPDQSSAPQAPSAPSQTDGKSGN